MNYMQIALVALGIALVSFNDFVTDGFELKDAGGMKQLRYFLFSLIAILFFVMIGLLVGIASQKIIGILNFPIASTILIIIGLKIVVEELLLPASERVNPSLDIQTLIRVTLVDGLTPFIVAVAVGLIHSDFVTPLLLLLIVIAALAAIGMIIGLKKKENQKKVYIAALGGLIILAAGLKMIITIIGD